MPRSGRIVALPIAACLAALPGGAWAQSSGGAVSVADFYKGNTVYMIIGSAAGGGFDFYARAISRFMSKHLPGNPTFVSQNMPGAGGLTAGTRVAVTAPQDGTYIGAIHPSTIVSPVLGEKAGKPINFAYLGSASANIEACYLRTDAPAKSFADGFKTEMVMGASTGSSSSREYASLLKTIMGMNIKIVTGYKGSNDVLLALERGEVQGTCAGLSNTLASRPNWFKDNIVRVISYQGNKEITGIKELAGVKPAISHAKTAEQRAIFELYDLQAPIGRPYATGGTVPKDRVKALQAAFMASMGDPELKKEILAKGLELEPISGEEVTAIASKILNAPPEIIKKTRAALGYD